MKKIIAIVMTGLMLMCATGCNAITSETRIEYSDGSGYVMIKDFDGNIIEEYRYEKIK